MKGNLLLVDDEPALSENMKELLEEEAHEIYTATNGRDALEIIQNYKIDCVISDIRMPIMDGIKFLKNTRERGYEMPFIFYSGHGSDQLKRELTAMGALDLLTKPNYANLELMIRELFLNH